MGKVSDFFEKYTNEDGEVIYRFRPLLRTVPYSPVYLIQDDSELEQIKIIEIPKTYGYLDKGITSNFPNLQKIILLKGDIPHNNAMCFGDAAFQGCPNLREVHLHQPMCFINLRGNLDWKIPFCDSNNATFIYYPDASLDKCMEEIKRWHIKYKPAETVTTVSPCTSMRRLHLH